MFDPFIANEKPTAGKLLISEPFMGDPNFRRGVVLLCEYNEEGSMGYVLNKPLELTFSDVMDVETILDIPLYMGGPVQHNTLHYLHRDRSLPDAREVFPGLYWGGDFEVLLERIQQNILPVQDYRFFLGYSGWGHTQLEDELEAKSWLVVSVDADTIFDNPAPQLWREVLQQMGGTYKIVANAPDSPYMN